MEYGQKNINKTLSKSSANSVKQHKVIDGEKAIANNRVANSFRDNLTHSNIESIKQRKVVFGDDSHKYGGIAEDEMAENYLNCLKLGNTGGARELDVMALRGSNIPDIGKLIDHLGDEAVVTIRRGVHADDRTTKPHQTVNVKVNDKTWKYHVYYTVSGKNWKFSSLEQVNGQEGKPDFSEIKKMERYDGASMLDFANLAFEVDLGAGKYHRVGPIAYTLTGKTNDKNAELDVISCPEYVGLEGTKMWISKKSLK